MRIAFLCCHLSGTGHLVRTLALAAENPKLNAMVVLPSPGMAEDTKTSLGG